MNRVAADGARRETTTRRGRSACSRRRARTPGSCLALTASYLAAIVTASPVSAATPTAIKAPQRSGDEVSARSSFLHEPPFRLADNLEPLVLHPTQERAARTKLAAAERRFDGKPNVLLCIVENGPRDETAWPAALEGQGLELTWAYGETTAAESRATILTGQRPLHRGRRGGQEPVRDLPAVLERLGYTARSVGVGRPVELPSPERPWFLGLGTERAGTDASVPADRALGPWLEALEREGALDNTIVVAVALRDAPPGSPHDTRVPFRVWWQGMIDPRRSAGLFDVADVFNTLISIAGAPGRDVNRHVSRTRYVDGVDQTSFWLADDGRSLRRSRIFTADGRIAAVQIERYRLTLEPWLWDVAASGRMWAGFLPWALRGDEGARIAAVPRDSEEANDPVDGSEGKRETPRPPAPSQVQARYGPVTVPLWAELTRYQLVLHRYGPAADPVPASPSSLSSSASNTPARRWTRRSEVDSSKRTR